MAGAYCQYCDRRCFVLRRLPDDQEWHLATCAKGMEHDRQVTGYDHITARKRDPREAAADRVFRSVLERHAEQVARGEHDSQCEWRAEGFYLCHCSKRRREHDGFTEPPGELIFNNPVCPRCYHEVGHDGDSFTCPRCCAYWDEPGAEATFYDEYGDNLAADLAAWEAHRAARGYVRDGGGL